VLDNERHQQELESRATESSGWIVSSQSTRFGFLTDKFDDNDTPKGQGGGGAQCKASRATTTTTPAAASNNDEDPVHSQLTGNADELQTDTSREFDTIL
jgi:hypothetical protein